MPWRRLVSALSAERMNSSSARTASGCAPPPMPGAAEKTVVIWTAGVSGPISSMTQAPISSHSFWNPTSSSPRASS